MAEPRTARRVVPDGIDLQTTSASLSNGHPIPPSYIRRRTRVLFLSQLARSATQHQRDAPWRAQGSLLTGASKIASAANSGAPLATIAAISNVSRRIFGARIATRVA